MRLTLIQPSVELSGYFLEMVEELKATGQPLAGTETLDRAGMAGYVGRLLAMEAGVGLESWQVPMSTFWLLHDQREVVGISRLRHRLTPTLRQHGGHIGFFIRPSARGKGYGVDLLALSLIRARDLGIDRVLLTCDSDNPGSRRIIERNGGQLEIEAVSPQSGKVIRRYWIELKGLTGLLSG